MRAQKEVEKHTAIGGGKTVTEAVKAVLALPMGRVEPGALVMKGFEADRLIFRAVKLGKNKWACTYIGSNWEKI